MTFLSKRLISIKPSETLAVNQKVRMLKQQGKKIIDFSIGEPDFDTPSFIKEAAIRAIQEGETKYTDVSGTESLKKAIQKKIRDEHEIDYKLSEIIVTVGAKQALFNAFLATLDDYDEVIIPSPYWVSYPEMVTLFRGKPIILPCSEEQNFKMTPSELEKFITPRTKWIIINTPNNPTGMCYSAEELKNILRVLERHPHVFIMFDIIYEHLIYDNFEKISMGSIAEYFKERLLIVTGISKSYAMTGWRLGYAMGPEILIKAMSILQSQSTANACSISQAAALNALQGSQDFLKEWVAIYAQRRNWIIENLDCRFFKAYKPQGAFYIFIDCRACFNLKTPQGLYLKSDIDMASYLLDEVGIALIPGVTFGLEGFLRISFALNENELKEAIHLMNLAASRLT